MSLTLKPYQDDTLGALLSYLESARIVSPEAAFLSLRKKDVPEGRTLAYRVIPGLEEVPYVCLRLPTGGGKTLLAAYSVPIVGDNYLDQEYPAVLWFVPTKIVQQQAVSAMKDEKHPYRLALDDAFGGRVRVFDASEINQIRPLDLREAACVIVLTLASVRIEDTESRRFYAHNESYEPFFRSVSPNTPGLERSGDGKIKNSFANILHLKRPVVIVDEAHNARTALTFESLARVNPACIVEFTATPDRNPRTGSNVLYSVSAKELRDADMIKLPIVLTVHKTWESAVHASVREREQLAGIARENGDPVRPLVLFQAQNRGLAVNVNALVEHLRENEGISGERIAVATGDQRGLEGIDLFAPDCKIDFVITVAALREGWDCSYAYVLCSVSDLRSSTAVEQLLGRIIRMPYATRRSEPALNKAYAHVMSASFAEAAVALQDKLVNRLGFDPSDFFEAIEHAQTPLFMGEATTSREVLVFELSRVPVMPVDDAAAAGIVLEPQANGGCRVSITGRLSDAATTAIIDAATPGERQQIARTIGMYDSLFNRALSPFEAGKRFAVPRLAVPVQTELELAGPELFLDFAQWDLLDFKAEIPFSFDPNTKTYIIDLQKMTDGSERVGMKFEDQSIPEFLLPGISTGWQTIDLVRWLDKKVRDPSIAQLTMLEWLRRLLRYLIEDRRQSLESLLTGKFILAGAIERYFSDCKKVVVKRGYQDLLFGAEAAPETTFQYEFAFESISYAPRWAYEGRYIFSKHFFPVVGQLKNDGEEYECARAIDESPQIDFWVRNLEGRPNGALWFPTSTDRFYPDFVAQLHDGRLLVVEYKGEVFLTNDDSQEKKQIGQLWASKSSGKCVFAMVSKLDRGRDTRQQIADAVAINK